MRDMSQEVATSTAVTPSSIVRAYLAVMGLFTLSASGSARGADVIVGHTAGTRGPRAGQGLPVVASVDTLPRSTPA
jgi:hypothetical protein